MAAPAFRLPQIPALPSWTPLAVLAGGGVALWLLSRWLQPTVLVPIGSVLSGGDREAVALDPPRLAGLAVYPNDAPPYDGLSIDVVRPGVSRPGPDRDIAVRDALAVLLSRGYVGRLDARAGMGEGAGSGWRVGDQGFPPVERAVLYLQVLDSGTQAGIPVDLAPGMHAFGSNAPPPARAASMVDRDGVVPLAAGQRLIVAMREAQSPGAGSVLEKDLRDLGWSTRASAPVPTDRSDLYFLLVDVVGPELGAVQRPVPTRLSSSREVVRVRPATMGVM